MTSPAPLSGRIALVTGAARGLGRAIAVATARAGADVVVLDLGDQTAPTGAGALLIPPSTSADLAHTVDLVAATGRRALPVVADVRDHQALTQAIHQAAANLGGLDLVAVNAGVAGYGPLLSMTPEQWSNVIDVNLTGAFNTISACGPLLVEAGGGRIVATASVAGRQGMPGLAHYAASKWGLIGLVKTSALELGPHRITVNAVAPTLVLDPDQPTPDLDLEASADEKNANEQTPQPPPHALPVDAIHPGDVADAVTFLFSDQARYISGTCLDIAAGANARYTA
ncbi:SDR family NAD(P)-dependent oxidoreductase [Nocardioides okcheonensis]|uniref:SDR family NAD(P)-dependent oxidoreductase n=1 Tax=Nocardioides okcheonensis TaxID=2894081 RepID=UPI001E329761|nr:SDR family NAD(P)-dependent oxidoreductase [Nocardioides okcheonensis]UFN45171.1 SDR family oxidoreductase [Nocardioides okcheonensis]